MAAATPANATQRARNNDILTIQFESKADADEFRDRFPDAIHPRDDARRRTVRFDESELTDREIDEIVAAAERGRAERQTSGQVPLTDAERNGIDFTEGRASVPHARSVKGIMLSHGVDDWLSYYDPTLTVDEHREVAERAARDVTGERLDVEDDDSPRGDLERALSDECDHAAGHCRRGDPEACEFLGEACGLSEDEIDAIMGIKDPDRDPDDADTPATIADVDTPFTGPQLGALRRAWRGYYASIDELEAALDAVREAERRATESLGAVNAIRAEAGQDPLEPERLEEIRAMHMRDVCDDPDADRSPSDVL